MILSDISIREYLETGKLAVDPLTPEQLQPASVDLRLSNHFLKVDENRLDAIRLVDPHCATCGNKPEVRDTMQFELDLSPISAKDKSVLAQAYGDDFSVWLNSLRGRLKPNVRATVFDKLIEGEGMEARPITRDLRWGVPVPATDLDGQPIRHEG